MNKDPDQGSGGGGSGLLSKVVKFVKSPTTHWSDLDRPETDSGDTQSRLALKEMIERKRRNDFVRNREFDMLRKLRRKETLRDEDGVPGQPSFYPSSQPANTGERARTLKKIDEIEAQMSTAWFRRQQGEAGGAAKEAGADAAESQPPFATAYDKTDPMPLERPDAPPSTVGASLEPVAVQAFVPTQRMDHDEFEAEMEARARARQMSRHSAQDAMPGDGAAASAPAAAQPGWGAFGELGDFQVEVVAENKLDPAIEEAAIRFANGDADGAEAGLRDLVADGGEREDDVDTWLTLFDLYRAMGEQDKFDDTALHFAARFGRSAPQWGAEAAPSSRPAPVAAAPAVSAARFHWSCPSTVGVQTVAALNATLARHAPPWRIDWRHLKAIEPAALQALHDVFQRWAGQPVRFKFLGSERLLQVLADNSPTDDRQVDTLWWETRLALLRVLGDMDEFELVALNYCVTYEVSPPAWEDPKNSYSPMTEDGDTVPPPSEEAQAPLTLPSRGFGMTDVMGASTNSLEDGVARGELAGELLNSAEAALKQVRIGTATTAIELNCRKLLRVDFGAAGDLLNWAMDQKGAGRPVSFRQVNRLVAAFFGVIGITDAARVALRTD